MDLNLSGKQALITGGSRGIGLAIAKKFAGEGCSLHLAGREATTLDKAKETLVRDFGAKSVTTYALDMADPASAKTLGERCGSVDILVNNAGAMPTGDLMQVSEAAWRAGWDAKVFGYINLTREILPKMKERRSGVVINIVGLIGEKPTYDAICRGAANAALIAFTRALGAGSVDYGVRVVGINPATTRTERSEATARARAAKELGDAERWREFSKGQPFGRLAESEEMADVAVFLASDRAGYVSGTVVNVDGGLLYRK